MDFVTALPFSNSYTVILTMEDCFSEVSHFVPYPKLPSAKETANWLSVCVVSPPMWSRTGGHSLLLPFEGGSAICWGLLPVCPQDSTPSPMDKEWGWTRTWGSPFIPWCFEIPPPGPPILYVWNMCTTPWPFLLPGCNPFFVCMVMRHLCCLLWTEKSLVPRPKLTSCVPWTGTPPLPLVWLSTQYPPLRLPTQGGVPYIITGRGPWSRWN